jgi:thiol-disulfide isomerase/thioredoxin
MECRPAVSIPIEGARMRRRLSCLLAVILLGVTAGQPTARGQSDTEKPASLTLKDMQGKKAKLSDLRGKVVVLNFWATWCGPCNVEMPMLVKAANTYGDKGVVFVGISVDSAETQAKVGQFVKKLQIEYPIWVGATDVDMKRLGIGDEVPGTLFVDSQGIVRARILGQMRQGEIEERVDWLLRNQQGDPPAPLVKHLDAK